jgi:hypothetical protein
MPDFWQQQRQKIMPKRGFCMKLLDRHYLKKTGFLKI